MDDLVTFLRAQLDEDERVANAAPGPEWRTDRDECCVITDEDTVLETHGMFDREATVMHAARHDPARVLLEIKAKRQIIRWWEQWSGGQDLEPLLLLAQPYSDRPGWREEWR